MTRINPISYPCTEASFRSGTISLGGYKKTEVRALVEAPLRGLAVVNKRESMGVCFIGKRKTPRLSWAVHRPNAGTICRC